MNDERLSAMDTARVRKRLLMLLLLAALLAPRLLAVRQYVTIDEPTWLTRSFNFYRALARGDFAATYQTAHPGVTTMWAGAAALLAICPTCAGADPVTNETYEAVIRGHGRWALDLLAASRAVIIGVDVALLLLAYAFARPLLGHAVATVGFLLLALDPFFIAHTQVLHLDGLMASLMLLSLLAFIYALRRSVPHRRARLALTVSGAAAGLSWLTKSPGFFLIPAVGLVTAVDTFWRPGFRRDARRRLIRRRLVTLALWGLVGLAVFVLLWPAMWAAPVATLRQMAEAALAYAEGGHESPVFFNGTIFPSGRLGLAFYPVSYLWRSTPVVVLGLLIGVGAYVLTWRRTDRGRRLALGGLLIFTATFALQLSLGYKKFDRYLIPIYGPLMLVSAYGWIALGTWLTARWRYPHRRIAEVVLTAGLVLAQLAALAGVFPYALSYFSPLPGGADKAVDTLTVGWGEGLDAAARYLNGQPDAATLRVAAWYRPCFSFFFAGETLSIDNAADISEEHLQFLLEADYLVVYVHQWQREIPRRLIATLSPTAADHVITINGIPYSYIYDLRDGDPGAD